MSESHATRIGRGIGELLVRAIWLAAGYVWAKHGLYWAIVVVSAPVVVLLALSGALAYPWRKDGQ